MQIHDLGSLWAESGGIPLALNGNRLAAALAALVMNLNDKVRSDVLIDAVWGDHSSPRASAALDTLMWRLRRVLDPERSARASSAVLRTEEHGYRLTIPEDCVDSRQFAAFFHTITAPDQTTSAASMVELTGSALALWRGRPYDDVDDNGWLQSTRARLIEQHLFVQQRRIDALLESGQPEQALAELVPALVENPFVERLWAGRIRALYQAGRPSAGLAAYAEVQQLLARELGTSPGRELQLLQQQILRQDPALPQSVPVPAKRGTVRIPRHRTSLIGRADDVEAVDGLLQQHRFVSITGPVGCGKTRLVAAVAQQVQERFPDGVYFVDLSDVTEAAAVADRVQETLGVEGAGSQTSAQAIAEVASERTVLLVLDNCEQVRAAASTLVETVLEAAPEPHVAGFRVLATSRWRLDVQGEVVHVLRPLALPSSTSGTDVAASPAARLFAERSASHGAVLDLNGPQREEIVRICEATDGLPLGIELAAARTRIFQLHEIATNLSDNPTALGEVTTSSRRASGESLRQSIDKSHVLLTELEQVAHRRLSVLPPGFTLEAAVAVCGPDVPAELVPNALIGLVEHSMLQAGRPERPEGPSLFRQLVPIRAHAARQLADGGEGPSTTTALLAWIFATVASGPRMGQSDHGEFDRRLEDNRRTITAALESAILEGPSDDVLLTLCRLVPYWWLDGKLSPETVRLIPAALAAASDANSDFTRAAVTAAHGSFLAINRQSGSGRDLVTGAIAQLCVAPSGLEVFASELLLAVSAACWLGGDMAAADAAADGVLAYGELLDDDHVRVLGRAVRCAIRLGVDPEEAGRQALGLLAECKEVGNDSAAIMCYHTLYMSALFTRDSTSGLHWNAEAIRVQREIGQRNAAPTLEARGSLHMLAGNPAEAARCYGSAHFQCSRLGRSWPQVPGTDELLIAARSQLSAREFDAAWNSGERMAASNLTDTWA